MHVSVVIPSFNRGLWLKESVESALAQTYDRLNVVVVDDGSTDSKTLEFLETLGNDPRVTVLTQKQRGAAAARNLGIEASDSQYILPLDDDDLIAPSYAAKAVSILESDPSIGVVYSRARKFGAIDKPWSLPAFTMEQLALSNCVFVSAVYRKKDWQTIGGYNEDLTSHEDWDFWIRMTRLDKEFFQIPEELFLYRTGHESITNRASKTSRARLEAYTRIHDANPEFFAEHTRTLFREYIKTQQELTDWRQNYWTLDKYVGRQLLMMRKAKGVYQRIGKTARATCLRIGTTGAQLRAK